MLPYQEIIVNAYTETTIINAKDNELLKIKKCYQTYMNSPPERRPQVRTGIYKKYKNY